MAWVTFENNKGGVDINYIIEAKASSHDSDLYCIDILYNDTVQVSEKKHTSVFIFQNEEERGQAIKAINDAMNKKFNPPSTGVIYSGRPRY